MTIGEFSALTGISSSALRYYESRGLLRTDRDGANRRQYSARDMEWVQFLQRLKSTGMPLREMRHYAELRYEGDATMGERLELLRRHQRYVEARRRQWEEHWENLREKIAWYEKELRSL